MSRSAIRAGTCVRDRGDRSISTKWLSMCLSTTSLTGTCGFSEEWSETAYEMYCFFPSTASRVYHLLVDYRMARIQHYLSVDVQPIALRPTPPPPVSHSKLYRTQHTPLPPAHTPPLPSRHLPLPLRPVRLLDRHHQ